MTFWAHLVESAESLVVTGSHLQAERYQVQTSQMVDSHLTGVIKLRNLGEMTPVLDSFDLPLDVMA